MNLAGTIKRWRFTRYEVPCARTIGDRLVRADRLWVGALELQDDTEITGLGFCLSLLSPLPTERFLNDYIGGFIWPALEGQAPEGLVHRVIRPRSGLNQSTPYNLGNAIDQALWDLSAKRVGLPLYRYLGGTRQRVPAYASGLCFHLSDQDLHDFYAQAAAAGYQAFKVKVGHTDPDWDVGRLQTVQGAVGANAKIMVDANEAWTPNETVRRVRKYEEAGIRVHWVEDPILRSDFTGLRHLRSVLGNVQVNSGEYLDVDAKLALLAADAVDVVNVNDGITDSLRVAWLCASKGVPVTLGNTIMNIGAHLAAALPEVDMVEDSQLPWTQLLAEPIPVVQGCFMLTDRPGHGLTLSADAASQFQRP